jgi:hypothetical protein
VRRWSEEYVWNWLIAWHVPAPVANAVYAAGVDGRRLAHLYWDAFHRQYDRPNSWVSILGIEDFEALGRELVPVVRACKYAEGLGFLLTPGPWVSQIQDVPS